MRTGTPLLATILAAPAVLGVTGTAATQSSEDARHQRGAEMIRSLNGGRPQPALEGMREEFTFLAEATEAYALGDVWSRPGLDPRTRQLATVSTFAALGNIPYMKIHAGYALNLGVPESELKEIVYLTTVYAGFPRAIGAARGLSELFAERRRAGRP